MRATCWDKIRYIKTLLIARGGNEHITAENTKVSKEEEKALFEIINTIRNKMTFKSYIYTMYITINVCINDLCILQIAVQIYTQLPFY